MRDFRLFYTALLTYKRILAYISRNKYSIASKVCSALTKLMIAVI